MTAPPPSKKVLAAAAAKGEGAKSDKLGIVVANVGLSPTARQEVVFALLRFRHSVGTMHDAVRGDGRNGGGGDGGGGSSPTSGGGGGGGGDVELAVRRVPSVTHVESDARKAEEAEWLRLLRR
jgi:hypothetical protein